MKEIIILQNSVAFSVDINQLYAPEKHRLHLIVNQDSFRKLQARWQDRLFHEIYVIEDFSFEKVAVIVETIIYKNPLADINIATNSEWCILLCGQLRQHFNITGLDAQAALQFTNKIEMKKALKNSEVRMPKHLLFNEEEYNLDPDKYIEKIIKILGTSLFAKPLDDANSNFTCRINSAIELSTWAKNKEKNKNFELDEYIEGKIYHIDAITLEGEILDTYVCEYIHPPFEFLVGNTIGNITLPNETYDIKSM